MSRYDIVFSARIVEGFSPEQVRNNLCQLFKTDPARVEALFSARRAVIKKGLDLRTAEKYRAALERAGAFVEVVRIEPEPAVPAVGSGQDTSPAPLAPRDDYMAAFRHIEAADFEIAPAGSLIQENVQSASAPEVDVSKFSLAPVGSDMGELERTKAVEVPDISHLTLQQ